MSQTFFLKNNYTMETTHCLELYIIEARLVFRHTIRAMISTSADGRIPHDKK